MVTKFCSPADGDIIENPDISFLRILILYVGKEYWNSGAGQGYITYVKDNKDQQLLITFDQDWGFYLEFQSNQEDTQVTLGKGNFENTVSPYIGGNPVLLPTKFFITREKALLAIEKFVKTGDRTNQITWGKESEQNWHYGYVDEDE
jgi:hypothetical protein